MIQEIKEIVEYSLYRIGCYSDDALALVVRTGMAESGYRELRGRGKGNPAIGFWQIEPATMYDMMKNYIQYRSQYKFQLMDMGMDFEDNTILTVMSNLSVQAALCRLHYRRDRERIPCWADLEAQGEYWKRVYNTELGRGTVKHFIEANKKIGFS